MARRLLCLLVWPLVNIDTVAGAAESPSLDTIRAAVRLREAAVLPRGFRFVAVGTFYGPNVSEHRKAELAARKESPYDEYVWMGAEGGRVLRRFSTTAARTYEVLAVFDGTTTIRASRELPDGMWRGTIAGGYSPSMSSSLATFIYCIRQHYLSTFLDPAYATVLGSWEYNGHAVVGVRVAAFGLDFVYELRPDQLYFPARVSVGFGLDVRRADGFDPPVTVCPGGFSFRTLSRLRIDGKVVSPTVVVPAVIEHEVIASGDYGLRLSLQQDGCDYSQIEASGALTAFPGDGVLFDEATQADIAIGAGGQRQLDAEAAAAMDAVRELKRTPPGSRAAARHLWTAAVGALVGIVVGVVLWPRASSPKAG